MHKMPLILFIMLDIGRCVGGVCISIRGFLHPKNWLHPPRPLFVVRCGFGQVILSKTRDVQRLQRFVDWFGVTKWQRLVHDGSCKCIDSAMILLQAVWICQIFLVDNRTQNTISKYLDLCVLAGLFIKCIFWVLFYWFSWSYWAAILDGTSSKVAR